MIGYWAGASSGRNSDVIGYWGVAVTLLATGGGGGGVGDVTGY